MAVGYAAAFEQGPLHGVVVCALQIEVKELAINLNKVPLYGVVVREGKVRGAVLRHYTSPSSLRFWSASG